MSKTQPSDQFQIGERVLYVHEGVCTTVTGYIWHRGLGGMPEIAGYELECGIEVPKDAIEPLRPIIRYELCQ